MDSLAFIRRIPNSKWSFDKSRMSGENDSHWLTVTSTFFQLLPMNFNLLNESEKLNRKSKRTIESYKIKNILVKWISNSVDTIFFDRIKVPLKYYLKYFLCPTLVHNCTFLTSCVDVGARKESRNRWHKALRCAWNLNQPIDK